MKYLVIIAVCLIVSNKTGSACSCLRSNITQVICSSSFVATMRINSEPQKCNNKKDYCYSVSVENMIKGSNYNITQIRTSASTACGIKFKIDNLYLMASRNTNVTYLRAYACGYRENWTKYSPEMKSEKKTSIESISCPIR